MRTEQPSIRPGAAGLAIEPVKPAVGPSFALAGTTTPILDPFLEQLVAVLIAQGFEPAAEAIEADLVVNVVDPARPRPFRRKSRGTFVAALAVLPEEPADGLRETYPLLVRALANIVLCYIPGDGRLVHDDGARPLRRLRERRCRDSPARVVERLRAARPRPARDRERVPARPRARALGRRRAHRARSRPPAGGSTGSASCRRRSRSRSCSTSATSATSNACTGSAGSRTGTSRRARTRRASG